MPTDGENPFANYASEPGTIAPSDPQEASERATSASTVLKEVPEPGTTGSMLPAVKSLAPEIAKYGTSKPHRFIVRGRVAKDTSSENG